VTVARKGRPRRGSIYVHGASVTVGHDAKGKPVVQPAADGVSHWDVRVTLPDGSRSKPIHMKPGMSEARARDRALRYTQIAEHEGGVLEDEAEATTPEAGETFAAYVTRWCAERERRGLTSAHDDRGRLTKWACATLGPRAVASIATRDLERLVEDLDNRVRARELSWQTARNTWGAVSKLFHDACRSKALALRVREDNPAAGVAGPDRGVRKSKSYLYPAEFLSLASCPRVPLRWRRLFALAIYTYTRAGELEALEREDVDLTAGVLHVHRAIDRSEAGEVKETKTNNPRRIPIEPTLAPLLEALAHEGEGPNVLAMPPACDLSKRLRQYLKWAGVTRAELFANDRTRKQITFHDLRATGVTWMAMRGDGPMLIMQRAGHADFKTTMGYVREAENLGHATGAPFPPLPAALLSPGVSSEGPATWAKLRGSTWKKKGVPSGIRIRAGAADPPVCRDDPHGTPGDTYAGKVDKYANPRGETKPAGGSAAAPNTAPTTRRARMLANLAADLQAAAAEGDAVAVRIAHEAIGRLLAASAAEPAAVVDLDAERARRNGAAG
jgi:integrase